VAENPNTPVGVLKELYKDKNKFVRAAVAENPNSTDRVLVSVFEYERKRKRPDRDILEAIIDNANCPGYLKAVIQTMLDGME
jgi:3-methyladenine DNA glycosylase AlkC